MRSVRRSATALVLLSAALALLPGPVPRNADLARPSPALVTPTNATTSRPVLEIDPNNWTLETGESATFRAAWIGVPPGCSLETGWFRWGIATGGSDGELGVANRSAVTFTAEAAATGTTRISVRSATALRCRGNETAWTGAASANITVLSPVDLSELSATPNPAAPGSLVELTGTVEGGIAPYRLRVAWGDGNSSWTNLSGSGAFAVPHRYATAGRFAPQLLLYDNAGDAATGTLHEPINVTDRFAAGIIPSTFEAEVGVPVSFDVRTLNAPPAYSSFLACPDTLPESGNASASGERYVCDFATAGNVTITFEAVAGSFPFDLASAALLEPVSPAPTLTVGQPGRIGEVDRTFYVPIQVEGGVPPFTVTWSLVGAGRNGTLTLAGDGAAFVPVTAGSPGAFDWSGVAVDGFGIASSASEEPISVAPALQVAAGASVTTADGTTVNVSASAVGGVPPYAWTVVPSRPAVNGSRPDGVSPVPGAFGWNATYQTEGALGLELLVVDADGELGTENLTVATIPAVTAVTSAAPAGAGRVALTIVVRGGVAPYHYRLNDSEGDVWNGTWPTPGSRTLTVAIDAGGLWQYQLRVTDGLGFSAATDGGTTLPATASTGGGSPSAPVGWLLLAVIAAAVTAGYAVFRRRASAAVERPPPPDPVAVLREVIAPCDGVDRGLVEYLAEERGVTPDVVATTLDRLEREGRLRVGRGADGEEVYAWVDPLPS